MFARLCSRWLGLAALMGAAWPAGAAVYNPETFTLANGLQVVVVSTEGGLTVSRRLSRGALSNVQLRQAYEAHLPVEAHVHGPVGRPPIDAHRMFEEVDGQVGQGGRGHRLGEARQKAHQRNATQGSPAEFQLRTHGRARHSYSPLFEPPDTRFLVTG